MRAIACFGDVNDLRDRFFPSYRSLSSEQLDWRPEGSKNNIGFLLRHVAQSEDWFIRVVISGENVTPKRKAELPNADAIVDYLRETRERTIAFLESNPIEILRETRTFPEGFRGEPVENPSIGWIVHRLFDHEAYHLGQVNMLMRLQGIDPPKM